MNILLIGNDQEFISLSREASIRIYYAPDIQSGAEVLSRADLDVILTDLTFFSHEDQEKILKFLKSSLWEENLPVIVLTEPGSDSGRKALLAGAQEYLVKTELSEGILKRILSYAVRLNQNEKKVDVLSREPGRLESSENTFQSFFEHSPIGMALLSREGEFIRTNRSLQNMSGSDKEELQGRDLSSLIHPEDVSTFLKNYQDLVEGENDYFEMENRFLKKSGQPAWCRLNISLVRDLEGGPLLIFGVIKDITRWKKSEVDLKKAKEVAEESTRTKSEFLAHMSHEIRTPIHTITGMTELLLETGLDAEQREYTEQVRFSADVLLSLINDILDFSKIEAGKLSFEVIDFDLYKMVEDAVDLVTLEAHKKGLEVSIDIDSLVPHLLRGDPVRLRQIIVNLFNNAVKFTKEGEINIFVEQIEDHDNRSTIKFRVVDTGIGISNHKLDRLFRSFSQVDSSMTRKYGGTGLGLSISKKLSELMGGRIGVESEEGKGSTFWFTVVLEKQAVDNLYKDVPKDFFEGLKVLLVDDNKTSRSIMKKYLRDWGCRVAEVEDGPAALGALRSQAGTQDPYRLALVDLRMPRMDGWQLASEINADKSLNSARLILLTPAGRSGDEAKMKLLKWFDGYLGKPVKKGELLTGVFKVINSDIELEPIEAGAAELEKVLEEEIPHWQEMFKILVAEDHEVNQQLFKTILEKIGYRVDLADDGAKALQMTGRETYHLIFMDIQMPNMNGYEAAKAIRARGIKTPIIAVTANALKEEVKKYFEAGMNDYLTKPFKKKDLLPVLQKWLDVSAIETSGPVQEETDPVFDYRKAVETFMGREDVVKRVLGSFVEKVENQLKTIGSALDSEDFEAVRIEAHSIKGGSWNLGAKRLGDAAKSLEEAGREKLRQEARKHLEELGVAFERFREVVIPIIGRQ